MKRVALRCLTAGIAVFILLLGASSALAFSVANVTVTPRAPVAGEPTFGLPADSLLRLYGPGTFDPFASGAHPVMDITTQFDVAGNGGPTTAKEVVQHLGAGIVSNPNATLTATGAPTKCARTDFKANDPTTAAGCTLPTLVGGGAVQTNSGQQIGTTDVTIATGANPPTVTLHGKLFNLAPDPQADGNPLEIAAIGSDLDATAIGKGHIKSVTVVTLSGVDLGLDSTSEFSNAAPILAVKQSLWGYEMTGAPSSPDPRDPPAVVPNFTNPTACVSSSVTVKATAFDDETSTKAGSYTPTDCANAPFNDPAEPALVKIDAAPITDTPERVAVSIDPSPIFVPRFGSYVKKTKVVLPPGFFLNPTRPDGLPLCTDAQFKRNDGTVKADCPTAARIGEVSFESKALGKSSGIVYISDGGGVPGDVVRLMVDVQLTPTAHVKLLGDVQPDPVTGQVTTVFDNLPQTQFDDFTLTFDGGPHASLATPAACVTGNVSAALTPFSGNPDLTVTTPFTPSFDGHGAACPNLFRPAFDVSLSNPNAGQTTNYTLTFGREDRDQLIDHATFSLPAGLVGNLALPGLTQCSLADAAASSCAASSRVGSATVTIGSGPGPVTLPGQAFLTVAQAPGDPAGLSISVPAKVGGIDLGRTVVNARLQLRPDGGLTATTTTLPLFVKGVPSQIRAASVTIDRSGFLVTPTSCGAQPYSATFTSVGGTSVSSSFSRNLANCARLRFTPKLTPTIGAKKAFKTGQHPAFTTVLMQPKGQANPRTVRVILPSSMSTDLKALNAACTQAAYDAGKCGSKAKTGTAIAQSPLLKTPLTGSAYFVKVGSGKLPKLVIALRGALSLDVTGATNVAKNGQLTTTITAPDVPVSRFSLTVHGGRGGVLLNNRNVCTAPKKRLVTLVQSTGQNGKKTTQRAATKVTGCPKPKKPKKKAKKHHR
jgi:hypothetical protein